MARIENALVSLVELFNEYADKDGYITLEDFKAMLDNEISCKEVKEQITDDALDEAFGELDRNSDGAIDIREFTRGISFLMKCLYHVDRKLS